MLNTSDPVGRRVRTLRLAHALSQQDLADRAGVHRHTIVQLEAGHRSAHPATMRKVARALGVQPMQITLALPEKRP